MSSAAIFYFGALRVINVILQLKRFADLREHTFHKKHEVCTHYDIDLRSKHFLLLACDTNS